MQNRLLDAAEYWTLGLGIAVIPLGYRAKRPDGQALKQAGYKVNGAPEWQRLKTELPGEDVLRLWFTGPQRNIGVVTGWQGLVVIDFDERDAYDAWTSWTHTAGEVAEAVAETTYRVFTRRGVHVYVSVEEPVPAYHVGAIDIKAAGGYVLAPPSIHPSGARYTEPTEYLPVVHVDRLADVFPFEPPTHEHRAVVIDPTPARCDDPWTQAVRATERAPHRIDEIRSRVSILEFFPEARKTSGDGRWWIAHCPFHQDENPSLWIDTKFKICGCLAGCTSKPLDVINLYQRLHGCDAAVAVRELVGPVPGLEGGGT